MAFVTTGLTNGGRTTHYQIQYDDSLSAADGLDRANALIGTCEADYDLVSGWFNGIALPWSVVTVRVNAGALNGAHWSLSTDGVAGPIDLIPGNGSSLGLVRYLLVAEVAEMFMYAQNGGWFGVLQEGSAGEGLSRFLAAQFLIANGLGEAAGDLSANAWMNSPREDYVNNVDPGSHSDEIKIGCAALFINYLHTQLGFSINQIVAAAAPELSGVYKKLTNDGSDPFPTFKGILDAAYPGTATIPGPNPDNPWPLPVPDGPGVIVPSCNPDQNPIKKPINITVTAKDSKTGQAIAQGEVLDESGHLLGQFGQQFQTTLKPFTTHPKPPTPPETIFATWTLRAPGYRDLAVDSGSLTGADT